jgi:hypothetical protein
MLEQVKKIMEKLNKAGVPLPVLRDPQTGLGSVTLTLLFISANVVLIALLNSFAKVFKGVDTENALQFFLICLGGYLGRRFQGKNISLDSDKKE